MTDLERLSAELEALKQRVALLEANASQKPKMVYNWHLREPERQELPRPEWIVPLTPIVACSGTTAYEHYIDPAMRMTRNGN